MFVALWLHFGCTLVASFALEIQVIGKFRLPEFTAKEIEEVRDNPPLFRCMNNSFCDPSMSNDA